MKKIQVAVLFAVFIAVISLPYVIAASAAGDEYVFLGFLANPIDGGSYLAKMQQGFHRSWTFRLPYTAEPGEGVYLFLGYLLLGHLARISGLSLVVMFHLARVAAGVFMLWEAYQLARATLKDESLVRMALILMAFGSGAGWLLVAFGVLTSDFWVAEAYPFLSAYTNPHFPLGLGLMFWILRQTIEPVRRWLIARLALSGVILSLVMPFGVVITGVVVFGLAVWDSLLARRLCLRPAWVAVAAGVPYVLYATLVAFSHPVLAGWNQQNLTLTPPPWDLLVSFSPALLLVLIGGREWWPCRDEQAVKMLILWLVLTLVLVYIPIGLQRRFLSGVFAPIAILSVYGMKRLAQSTRFQLRTWFTFVLVLSLPTNLFLIAGAMGASNAHSPDLYMTRAENDVLRWIADHTDPDSVILASSDTSLWIPALTNRRVVYGHPFETVPADEMEDQVLRFYQGTTGFQPFDPVEYVIFGPREHELMNGLPQPDCPVVYQNSDVIICSAGAVN